MHVQNRRAYPASLDHLAQNEQQGFFSRHKAVIAAVALVAVVVLAASAVVFLEIKRREMMQLISELAPDGRNPINQCSRFFPWCG